MTNADHAPYETHPLASLFTLIEGAEFAALVESIRRNGVIEPIVLCEGKILDGRNRARACVAAGVEPAFITLDPDTDPLAFVIARNLHRRHLNESQRAMVAAKLATMRQGERTDLSPIGEMLISQGAAAGLLNVGKRSVERAANVIERGAPELSDAVTRGKFSVSAAAEIVKALPADEQRALVMEVAKSDDTRRAFAQAVKELRREGQDEKRERRDEREAKLAAKQHALPEKRYGVILADPEWHDEVWGDETGMDRHAANHYPTSDADAIAARLVARIAAPDAVLFLWTTNQHLRIAIAVMEAWGFAYKSNYAWGKDKIGLGRWNRSKHELLLIGTIGSPPCPAPGSQWESLQFGPRGKHSEKPGWQYELIESYFPHLLKIELNARQRRPGWDAWGHEVPGEG
jgi:N6-adenosine-specific RNA methylase IME4/ParB-like chromosome segregation protein Spo0J